MNVKEWKDIYEQTQQEYGIVNIANLRECAERREKELMTQLAAYTIPRPDLDEIDAECEAATPGPWKPIEHGADGWKSHYEVSTEKGRTVTPGDCSWDGFGNGASKADAIFIAHSRTVVPALTAEIRRLRAELDAAERREQEIMKYVPQTCKTCMHESYCNFEIQCFGTNKENWKFKVQAEGEGAE